MNFKILAVVSVLHLASYYSHSQVIPNYRHNTFWGRITFSDKISSKLKWEIYLQKRTQNDDEDKLNIFKHHQLTSYWLWLHYQASPNLQVSLTPFCYFNTIALFPQPPETVNRGVNEYRWAVQLEHTQKLKHLNFVNRYSVEYRLRDSEAENVFVPNYRVRYRAKLEKPLKKSKHAVSIIVFDEVFLEFGKAMKTSPAVFNQNRLYAGFSYEIIKNIKFNLGYMYLIQERASGQAFDTSNVLWGVLTFDNVFSQFKKAKEVPEK